MELLIDRNKYDHTEHFDDVIREFRISERISVVGRNEENLLMEIT